MGWICFFWQFTFGNIHWQLLFSNLEAEGTFVFSLELGSIIFLRSSETADLLFSLVAININCKTVDV